jgi:Sugar-transfer associated ATP-grasp
MIWLTEAKGPFFAKPARGDRGRGIIRGCFEGDSVRLNGRLLGRLEFQAQLAATGEPYIVTAAVEQHPEMASFFPETVNTVRVLMMREPGGEAFVADAVLRLGTSSSGGVDNFSKGGLSFSIDTAVGKIGQGRRKTGAVFENHPDTGAPVSGCSIPHWLAVLDCCHAAMAQQPGLQYVGWDVVVARDGPVLIEGNNKSDVNLIQAHRPLLANARVRAFYERHGLLRHVPTTSL